MPDPHEEYLFELQQLPLIDVSSCLKNMNADESALYAIFQMLIAQEFPSELASYERAHEQVNWEKIEKLAHKMKGGAIYTGLVKLQHACQNYEDYYQSGQTVLLENLYQQILKVLQETQESLTALITEQKNI